MNNIAMLLGRILIGGMFLLAGLNKLTGDMAGTAGYMQSAGVPTELLWPVIVLELGAGLALILGWKTRLAALALAVFTVLAAVLFHNNFGDQTQMILFMKNLAIVGGLLYIYANGAGSTSVDSD